MTSTTCRRCHSAPVIAINLCRRCGLAEAEAEKVRRARAERRERIAKIRARGRQAPAEQEPDAA